MRVPTLTVALALAVLPSAWAIRVKPQGPEVGNNHNDISASPFSTAGPSSSSGQYNNTSIPTTTASQRHKHKPTESASQRHKNKPTPTLQFPKPVYPTPEDPKPIRSCGSRGLAPCFDDETCIDDPFNPGCKTALDCPGYCVVLDDSICGPVFGIACLLDAQICVDDPRDDCETKECPGTCVFLDRTQEAIIA